MIMRKIIVSIILVLVAVANVVYCAELKSQGVIYSNSYETSKIYNANDYQEEILKEGIEEVIEYKTATVIIPAGNIGESGIVSGKKEKEETVMINGVEYKKAKPFNPKKDGVPEFLKQHIK